MADKLLSESFETSGEWFLPEHPERKIGGILRYSSKGAELELHEAFVPLTGSIGPGDSLYTYPVIFGSTREGEAMTILRAHRASMSVHFGSGGVSRPERLLSSWLLIGGHVPHNFAYPEMSFRVPGLQYWLSQKVINESHSQEEATGQYIHTYTVGEMTNETIAIPSVESTINWYHQWHSQTDPFTSINVTVFGGFTIRPKEPQQIDWFLEQLGKVTTMLAYISGSPMSPDCITAGIGHEYRKIGVLVSFANARYCSHKNVLDFFMLRGSLGVDLADAMNRWFEIYPKVEKPSELAISVLASEKLWLHVEFLSLMQALEGFHRGLYEGLYMDDKLYEPVKKSLGDAIPANLSSDHKDALRSRIRYGNQISLRKRLDALSKLIPEPIRKIILGNDGKVPRSWIDTRNYYTHWDEELRANVLDTQAMYNANVRMRSFLRVLYLNLMNIPDESILSALSNHSNESQHLAQLNARDLSSNGRNATGVIMTITETPSTVESSDITDTGLSATVNKKEVTQ